MSALTATFEIDISGEISGEIILNQHLLVDKVKQDVPLACLKRRSRIAFIPLNVPPHIVDSFLRQF